MPIVHDLAIVFKYPLKTVFYLFTAVSRGHASLPDTLTRARALTAGPCNACGAASKKHFQ